MTHTEYYCTEWKEVCASPLMALGRGLQHLAREIATHCVLSETRGGSAPPPARQLRLPRVPGHSSWRTANQRLEREAAMRSSAAPGQLRDPPALPPPPLRSIPFRPSRPSLTIFSVLYSIRMCCSRLSTNSVPVLMFVCSSCACEILVRHHNQSLICTLISIVTFYFIFLVQIDMHL